MKVLILGSGWVQFDAIEYLLHRGIEVHIISNAAPGFDKRYYCNFEKTDIRNREEVLRYCSLHGINAVYTVGSDFGLLTSIYVSEKLGLPYFNSLVTTELFQNKKLFRLLLNSHKISQLKFVTAAKTDDLCQWSVFPCFIKPVDNQGQRGVFLINSREELHEKFACSISFSISGEVIVEEFISGQEISVNAFVKEGKIEHFFITDRITVEGCNNGIPLKHIIPSQIAEPLKEQVFEKCKVIIDAAGKLNGPVYFQIKYNDKTTEAIEVTPRLDGCHLWRLIYLHSGYNFLSMTFDRLLGLEKLDVDKNGLKKKLSLEFTLQSPGERFLDKTENSIFRIPYYCEGEIVRPLNGILEKTIVHLKEIE